jgi:hypothetical protein
MLRGENENRPPLSASEIENVRSRITGFVSDKSADAELLCGGSFNLLPCRILLCLRDRLRITLCGECLGLNDD